jgi:DNA-directed RNA polymerase specialized sigma24 family protein
MSEAARMTLLEYLGRPSTRSGLHAYIRRRGLADSAEDLVQTVLCDALAVQAIPSEETELRRFVAAIARNKVADEYRRRTRWKRAELPEQHDVPSPEASDLLRRIDADVVEPRQREALDWVLREHAGDSLYEIAREQALEPDTLRQRICRLRKQLRARYLVPLALTLAAVFYVAAVPRWPRPPALVVGARSPLSPYLGRWRVVRVEPARYEAMDLQVRIEPDSVRVYEGAEAVGRELRVEHLGEDEAVLRAGDARWVAKLERPSPGHLTLRTARGFVELELEP